MELASPVRTTAAAMSSGDATPLSEQLKQMEQRKQQQMQQLQELREKHRDRERGQRRERGWLPGRMVRGMRTALPFTPSDCDR